MGPVSPHVIFCNMLVQNSRDSKENNPINVASGLKATLNNSNVSEKAKKGTKERLNGIQ
ncbi:Conidiation protein 6 [Microdochium nivale]|nr:Conidiation protein 6 [Microdochium nivale]